jgi:iron complex outermembrane receptor protein
MEWVVHFEPSSTEGGGPSYESGAAAGGAIVRGVVGIRMSAWYRHDGGYVDRDDPFDSATVDADSNRSMSKSERLALAIASNDSLNFTTSVSYQSLGVHDTSTFYESLSDPAADVFKNGRLLA